MGGVDLSRMVAVARVGILAGVFSACSATAPPAEPPATLPPVLAEALSHEPSAPPEEARRPAGGVERALVAGLVAAKLGDFEAARREIGWVATVCPDRPAGHQALLALAGIELDPRNPRRDPAAARRAVERYLASPTKPAWTEPTAKTLYLLAVELGGRGSAMSPDEEEVAGEALGSPPGAAGTAGGRLGWGLASPGSDDRACDASAAAAPLGSQPPPGFPGEPLQERLSEAERERAELRETASRLERELAELRREMERIRRALRP